MTGADLVREALRTADRDRYLAALYAPEDRRDALTALYAFNAEIASIRDKIRDPLPGEVRLQWWRDVIAAGSASTGHIVADSLLAGIERHHLPIAAFQNYLDARIFDLYDDPMPSRADLEGYCGETAGAILQLSALVLDPLEARHFGDLAGRAGCAQAITGLLRLMPIHRARRQCYVPSEILSAAGLSVEEFLGDAGAGIVRAIEAMMALARDHMAAFTAAAPSLPPSLRPAYLPLAQSQAQLSRMTPANVLEGGRDLPAWRKQWTLFRHATRGWR